MLFSFWNIVVASRARRGENTPRREEKELGFHTPDVDVVGVDVIILSNNKSKNKFLLCLDSEEASTGSESSGNRTNEWELH